MKVVALGAMFVAFVPPNFTTEELLKPCPRMPVFAPLCRRWIPNWQMTR
jgi:hypothetical protein